MKNIRTTVGGTLASIGAIPTLLVYSHADLPLWWNKLQFPLALAGALGLALMGASAHDAKNVPTIPQVKAATEQDKATAAVKAANEPIELKPKH